MTDPYRTAGDIRASLLAIRDNYEPALAGTVPRDDSDARPIRAEAPPPVSAHILDVRAETDHDLHYYARFILEQVNDGTITTAVAATVEAMCRFIDTWALALAEQHPDDAEDCRRDLGRNGRKLAALVNGDYTRRFRIPHGACPELEWAGQTMVRCHGMLTAVMRQGDVMLPKGIVCDANPEHEWPPHLWPSLGRRLSA